MSLTCVRHLDTSSIRSVDVSEVATSNSKENSMINNSQSIHLLL